MNNKTYFKGYAFQIQLKFIGSNLGYRLKEILLYLKTER